METEPRTAFRDLLRHARRDAGLTQEELAERAGVSTRAISNLERGINRTPRRDTLDLLAEALKLLPEERRRWERDRRRLSARVKPAPAASRGDFEKHLPRPFSMLVGREREQKMLADCLEAAVDGRGCLVLVSGEAGIGKTALVELFTNEALGRGALVLTGHCYDLTTTPPFGPWVEALRAYSPAAGQSALPASLRPDDMTDDGLSQTARFEHTERFFAEISEQQSLVLVLEDLHWADDASLDLLRYLARRTRDQRLLLIVTCRDSEVSREQPLFRILPILVRESHATRIALRRLDANAVGQLLETRYRLVAKEQRRLITYLDGLGGGNPLYIEELLRTLEAEGLLRPGSGDSRLADLSNVHVPPLLQLVISRRLSQLSDATRDALAMAAVIGQDVPINPWSAVTGLSNEQLADIVDEAITAHVLEEQPTGVGLRFSHALVREAIYESLALPRRRNWHRRVAEALVASSNAIPGTVAYHYQQAGDRRAIEWHVTAGLQARRSAWISAAHHFETAATLMDGDQTQEHEQGWLRLYAAYLMRFSGNPRSIRLLDAAEQTAIALCDPVLAAHACYIRGSQRCMLGDIHRGLLDIRQGVAAIDVLLETEHVSDTEADALAVIQRLLPSGKTDHDHVETKQSQDANSLPGVNPQRGTLINWLGKTGRYDEAIAIGEAFIDELAATSRSRVGGLLGLGHAYAGLGQPEDARRAFALARAGWYALGDYAMVEDSIAAELLLALIPYGAEQLAERDRLVKEDAEAWDRCRGITITTAGDGSPGELQLDLLEGRWQKARRLATDHLPAPWITQAQEAIVTLGILDHHSGEPALALERVLQLLPQGPATDPNSYFAHSITAMALAVELALDAGDLTTAHNWIDAHDRWLDWSGAKLWQADNQLLWARLHECSGDLPRAQHHAERALTLASEPRQPLRLVAAHRMLGNLHRQEGHYDQSAAHLCTSLALADACAAPFERALSLLALAELHVATRLSTAAQTLLDEARSICQPLDARPTLERIDALEAKIIASDSTALATPGWLTARELEVLHLIATGRSNRQIADALYLSPRTVERHIANIYVKIDIHTRAEATAYAQRHLFA